MKASDFIGSPYCIPGAIITLGLEVGMHEMATGGGLDYMERVVETPDMNYLLRVCDHADAGSPDSLDAPADLQIVPVSNEGADERYEMGLVMRFETAREAIETSARIIPVYEIEDEKEMPKW